MLQKIKYSAACVGTIITAFVGAHFTEIEDKIIIFIDTFPGWTFVIFIVCFCLIVFLTVLTIQIRKDQKKAINSLVPQISNVPQSIKSCVVEHRNLHTWERIKNAKEEIILHAAYYPKYGIDSDYSNAFRALLRNEPTVKITVIITDINSSWILEFGKILRYEYDTIDRFKEGINSSISFFKKMQEDYPNRIIIKTSSRLPLMPMVIVDNDILVGHYCHAETPAPNGLWWHINSEKIEEIIKKVRFENEENRKRYIDTLTEEEQAISRYIEDAFDAIKYGKDI
ncbi:MAG: hypothetical protein IKM69_07480 [Alistipes sp.]|nr:hypothetical protein [Alistipes sp.]